MSARPTGSAGSVRCPASQASRSTDRPTVDAQTRRDQTFRRPSRARRPLLSRTAGAAPHAAARRRTVPPEIPNREAMLACQPGLSPNASMIAKSTLSRAPTVIAATTMSRRSDTSFCPATSTRGSPVLRGFGYLVDRGDDLMQLGHSGVVSWLVCGSGVEVVEPSARSPGSSTVSGSCVSSRD